MRWRICLAMLPALLSAADLHVDHVTVAGHDLRQLQEALAAIGIQTVYGGAHRNGVTEMSLTSFPDGSYLEAIGVQPKAYPQALAMHEWAKFLAGTAAACAW